MHLYVPVQYMGILNIIMLFYSIFLGYCKCITFGDVFFLAPLAVVSIRQIKYIAKCASISV